MAIESMLHIGLEISCLRTIHLGHLQFGGVLTDSSKKTADRGRGVNNHVKFVRSLVWLSEHGSQIPC